MELFNRVTMRDRTASLKIRKSTIIFNTAASRMSGMDKGKFVHFVKLEGPTWGFIVNNKADGYPISIIGETSSQIGCSKIIPILKTHFNIEAEDTILDVCLSDKVYGSGDQVFLIVNNSKI